MNEYTILQNIKKIRELKNLKKDYVAQELDLSLRAYTKVEAGETELTFKRFFKIATILKIKPEDLLSFNYTNIFDNYENLANHNINTFDQNLVSELLKSKDAQIKLLELRIFELTNN